ncbi:interferon-induced GTP-binding protein Mx3 [Colletotrichum spaethianum]|uniref:Interferon-induced GTP-binding protein Mx3 n=1 Tax=Colletotrichum spaethianum TaxID=700344 RepID=A0AA37LCD8_9PEZI|nr:interferon-induced GTP-binding protein Mx3 [Colletotrichum spaethianum]GKT44754.1 interferon-induced GTP-binding protein Mx3 [Colletotrichum spaethianum]
MTKARAQRGTQPIKSEPGAPHHSNTSPTPSVTNTFHGSSEQARNEAGSYTGPADVNQSFMRSDAPTPSVLIPSNPGLRSVRTALTNPTFDESEPVLLQVRNRDMDPPAASMQNDSFFDGSFRDIGAKVKIFNDTLGELQQIGVSHDVALPQLVLVGDQSAGKSSLMSGLAGLNLPRSEGVCTRCPIHIRVSRSGARDRGGPEWSCRVSLQQDYAFRPPPNYNITKADVTAENPFPPWVKQARVVKEFMTIYDQSDIDTVLKWAQIAILNHDQNHELYVPGTGAITKQSLLDEEAEKTLAKFSPNTVALEIKGPDLPDLSFYDMPGIFRNSAREEDEYLVSVVENLARQYISHAGALIIWAVPMNVDPETSSTLSIIRDLRAQQRTIGVMTKADLLPEGNNNQWMSMLRGERHKIGHEFFITSRPSDKNLDEQQRWEEAFFHQDSSERWPEEFHIFRERCGVEKLKTALSEKLGKEFAKNLPSIKQKVQTRLGEIERQLSTLPELPNNVELEVRKSLMAFSTIVKETLRGRNFSSNYGSLSESFRDCILQMKPKFVLKDKSDIPVLEISDDDNDSPNVTPGNRKRSAQGQGYVGAKRPRPTVNGGSFTAAVKTEDGGSTPPTPSRRRLPQPAPLVGSFQQYFNHGAGFRTLAQIRDDIRAKTKAGMPSIVPDEVYEDLCNKAVKDWDKPMATFLHETMSRLHKIVDYALDQAFGSLKKRLIFKESKALMDEFLNQRRAETMAFLKEVFDMETFQLFTINKNAFADYERSESRVLTRYRHVMRWQAFSGEASEFHDWEKMTPDQRSYEERKHIGELAKMGPDAFDKELKVAAYVRGYYMLSALRFTDTVCLSITSRMMPKIIQDLDFFLEKKLGLVGGHDDMIFSRLMEEDNDTAHKRERLKGELEKFNKALQSITTNELEGVSGSSSQGNAQFGLYAESVADSMELDSSI